MNLIETLEREAIDALTADKPSALLYSARNSQQDAEILARLSPDTLARHGRSIDP
ncbi:MAG: hypothetical protein ACJ8A0_21745 [Microvirga sp.]